MPVAGGALLADGTLAIACQRAVSAQKAPRGPLAGMSKKSTVHFTLRLRQVLLRLESVCSSAQVPAIR